MNKEQRIKDLAEVRKSNNPDAVLVAKINDLREQAFDLIKKLEDKTVEKTDTVLADIKATYTELENKINEELKKVSKDKDYSDDYFKKELQTLKNVIADVRAKKVDRIIEKTEVIKEVPNPIDTDKIATEASEIALGATKELIQKIPPLADDLPKYAGIYRDALETLKDEDRLDASAIKNLPESIEKHQTAAFGVREAPRDGKTYGRKDRSWTEIITTETDPLSLHLDQTSPQTVSNGSPIFAGGLTSGDNINFTSGANRTITIIKPTIAGTSGDSLSIISPNGVENTGDGGYGGSLNLTAGNGANSIESGNGGNGGNVVINAGGGGTDGISGAIILGNTNGNVGIGTTTPGYKLTVAGDTNQTGALRFNGNAGTAGFVLQSNGSSAPTWVSTTTLGISGGSSQWTTSGSNIYYNSGGVTIGDTSLPSDVALYVKGSGSSAYNWRGRIIAGGDNYAFLMGEYNSEAWLGAHNAALNAWAPFYINPDGTTDLFLGDSDGVTSTHSPIITVRNTNGRVGIGVTTPSTKLHVISTTEQLRLGYDASNYMSTTIGSAGSATFSLTGTTPKFTFSNPVILNSISTVGGTAPIADGTYPLTTTLGGSITIKSGLITGFVSIPI